MELPTGGACESDDDEASLGAGAFGEVYCMRGKIDNQIYAVKQIKVKKAEKAADMVKGQLLEEGSNMQRLNHRNIIRCWNQCQLGDGKVYCLVMDYADSGNLHEYMLKNGKVPTQQVRKWMAQLCAGLHHMHRECRMLHRDLKPQNLLLSHDNVSGELIIRITDFGLACLYETALSMSKAGSHQYMSPEKVCIDLGSNMKHEVKYFKL
jgi:serine/threonine protein kinase